MSSDVIDGMETKQEKGDTEKKHSSLKGSFSWFRLLFAAEPKWVDYLLVLCGTVCAAAAGVPFPLMGVLFGEIIDNFNSATCAADGLIASDPFAYELAINTKVIQTAYIGAIAFILIYGHLTCWNIISQRLAHRLRVKYVSSLLKQPASAFDVRGTSGQVSSRLNGDITAIQAGTSEKVGNIITTLSFFVTVFIIAFTKQPRLAGILTCMIPAFILSGLLGGKLLVKMLIRQNLEVSTASSIASEALSHLTVVQAFGAAPRLEAKFSKYMATARKFGVIKAAIAAIQTGLVYFIAYSGNALAFWQGSVRIADSVTQAANNTTVGEVYAIVYLIVDACVMLGGIAPSLPFLGAATAAYARLMADIELPSSIDSTSTTGRVLQYSKAKTISFRNVSFEYESRPGIKVLDDINLEFPSGTYTAIVGLSGSGKSTIASLVTRLYDPTSGVVELDGHDLRCLNVQSLRSYIGFVQQEPSLFDRSIYENIALGLLNSPKSEHQHLKGVLNGSKLSDVAFRGKDALAYARSKSSEASQVADLVEHAAAQADAQDFIKRLKDGYGSSAGLSGNMLSGGQRQRVALARALIRDPAILVLDEATASLDSTAEMKVQLAIERAAAQKRTVIAIAHRLSTIKKADNIIVMAAGQVVEQGTYEELIANVGSEFSRMVNLQTLATVDSVHSSSNRSSLVDDNAIRRQGSTLTLEKHQDVQAEKTSHPKYENGILDDVSSEDESVPKPFKSLSKGVKWLLRPSLGLLVIAFVAAFVVGCTFSGAGIIFGFTVGELNPCQSSTDRIRSRGRFFAGMYFLLACVEFIANFLSWWTFGLVAEKLLYTIRVLSLKSLLEQSIHWHTAEGRTPSSLLSIITKDTMAISNFSGSTFGTIFGICINVVVAIVVSHIFAWKIAIVCLATLPILLGAGFMQLRMLARYEERHQNAFTTATSLATEAIESIRTVAILSLEHEYMDSFKKLLASPRKEVVWASATTNIWLAISYTTGIFINALAYWWGSQLIMKGEYTQKDFLIILVAMLTSAQLWSSMFTLAPEFSRAHLALGRVMSIISMSSDISVDRNPPAISEATKDIEKGEQHRNNSTNVRTIKPGGSEVRMDNISFAYPGRRDIAVMRNLSLAIKANQFCGLVGPSGAGKSTILNLILRLYEPDSGTVYIDGQDISIHDSSFRDSIALVPQDPTLFDGSIRFNIGLGSPPGYTATDEEIETACGLANIHDVITELPDGYDTECGPNASRLSGGQKQRLAIARALVRRPRVLLLDESTSALDSSSEAALERGLERASVNTTVIAITHRLRTVQKADIIFVIEDGQVVDSGSHTDLMERRESYRINAMQQMLQ